MKKALSVMLALTLFLGLTSFAFAGDASSNSVCGKERPELKITSEQKAKMISLKTQILELKKQIIKQNVADGTITKDQAKLMEERINARLKALKSGKLGRVHRHHSPKCKKAP